MDIFLAAADSEDNHLRVSVLYNAAPADLSEKAGQFSTLDKLYVPDIISTVQITSNACIIYKVSVLNPTQQMFTDEPASPPELKYQMQKT